MLRRTFLLASANLLAQDATRFSADVNVVNVLASVRDSKGALVKDLSIADFQLEEEGRPQAIKYFFRQADLPLSIGLVIDTSGSMFAHSGEVRRAASRFLDQVLRPEKDLAFVLHFDNEVELLRDLTASKPELNKALVRLSEPNQTRSFVTNSKGFGTRMFDAVRLATGEILKQQTDRKAIILLSDGVDSGSIATAAAAIEIAQRSDTAIYVIYYRGNGPHRDAGKKVLREMSSRTGGSFFEPKGRNALGPIFSTIDEELRNQYSIGYVPNQTAEGFRRIKLTLVRRGLRVSAREGYYRP